jgi:uncharacterized protein with NAD-binding domain and iron-sulfur cluster
VQIYWHDHLETRLHLGWRDWGNMSEAGKKQKVAILGGGVGALSTAFLLTNQPDWQDRYEEITVYQLGWRLGGKGACGRNAQFGERIEEHGPHVWFGFYEVAFNILNGCYQYCRDHNLTPDSPFQTCIPDAMGAKDDLTLMELVDGRWKPWHVVLPQRAGEPFDAPADLISQLVNALNWLGSTHEDLKRRANIQQPKRVRHASLWARFLDKAYRAFVRTLRPPDVVSQTTAEDPILTRVRELLDHFRVYHNQPQLWRHRFLSRLGARVISKLLKSFLKLVNENVVPLLRSDDELRRAWLIIDLGVANLRGFFEDGILWNGFESINNKDYSDWLKQHDCQNPWSPIVQGMYDTAFCFKQGKTTSSAPEVKPESASVEAGNTLRCAMQLFFGYNGHFSYKMQSGMGDTIFTPLYLTLRHRGVKFRFFHQVTNLAVEQNSIAAIDINVQAKLKSSAGSQTCEYEPLRKVKGLYCWPNEPLFDQLVEGEELEAKQVDLESSWSGWTGTPLRLERGRHFDIVVLGISVGAFPFICKELIGNSTPWRDMVEHVATVQTQSIQLWLTKTAKELGWSVDENTLPSAGERQFELMASYVQPIDSWADMSQVLPREDWRGLPVKSVQYIFGPLQDAADIPEPGNQSDFPQRQRERAKQQAIQFLQTSVAPLWPNAVSANKADGFDWSVLFDLCGRTGVERFDGQFWRVNIEPSERYVLSVPGSDRFRLAPAGSGFANLYLAGDWTRHGLDIGCVEAAALSAKLAAEGIMRSGLSDAH